MSEQLTLDRLAIPSLLVVTLASMEHRAGRRLSVLSAASVIRCSRGRWWMELVVDGARHVALANRVDLEAAAGDLYHQIHGEAPRLAQETA